MTSLFPLERIRRTRESPEVIHATQVANSRLDFSFVGILVLAASIATMGLASDSEATIVGAMIISPLMQPIISLAYGVATRDLALKVRSTVTLVVGIAITLATAALVETVLSLYEPTEMILARIQPSLTDLSIAIAAAGAGAFAATRRNIASALPGVAIAVALVPPLCVTGIGLSVGSEIISVGSLMLFSVNLVAIVLVAACVFMVEGVGNFLRALPAVGLILVVILGFACWLAPSQDSLRRKDQAHEVIETFLRETYSTDLAAHPGDLNRVLVTDYPDHVYVFAELKGSEERFTQPKMKELHQRLTEKFQREVNLKVLLLHSNELTVYTKKIPADLGPDYGLDILLPK